MNEHVDHMDLPELRELLGSVLQRLDDLLAQREHEPAVEAYGLGYAAGQRAADPVDQLTRDQQAGRIRRVNATPIEEDR